MAGASVKRRVTCASLFRPVSNWQEVRDSILLNKHQIKYDASLASWIKYFKLFFSLMLRYQDTSIKIKFYLYYSFTVYKCKLFFINR